MDVGSPFGVVASVRITGGWWLARCGKGSTELSSGKVKIYGRLCVATPFCFDQELTVCFSFKAVMSRTRMIG